MNNKCIDCTNLQDLTTPRYRCKLNCVDRTITDSCCWNSKRYPSKFKPKDNIENQYTFKLQPTHDVGYGINDCEYLKRWRTTCRTGGPTNPEEQIIYNSYSCALFFCKYPGEVCEVKK